MTPTGTPFSIPGVQRWWLHATICELGDCQVLGPDPLTLHSPESPRPGRAYWAIRIREGAFGTVLLDKLCAVLALEAAEPTACAGWARSLYLDKRSNLLQREALEAILVGGVGTEFDALAPIFGPVQGTQVVTMDWLDTGRQVSLRAGRVLEIVADLPGRNLPHGADPPPRQSRGAIWQGRGCARFCGAADSRGLADGAVRLSSVFWHGAAAPRRKGQDAAAAPGSGHRPPDPAEGAGH